MQLDRPTTTDLLGRDVFAKRLAHLVAEWKGHESLVVGLYGPWGSGKTTLVQLLRAELDELAEEKRPITISFNPWQWNAQRAMTSAFFAEIATQLGQSKAKNAGELSRRLGNYGALVSVGSSIARSLEIASLAVAPAAAPALGFAQRMLKRSAAILKEGKDFNARDKSLVQLKAELRSVLEKESRNILVVLDDVDRLTSAETGELFQLIKVNADFPRLVYLVVCDPGVIEESLGELVNGRGSEFLQKIVQVPFHLPQALPWQRQQLLQNGIARLLGEVSLDEQMDWMRWEDAYDEAGEHYFETPRQIIRFLDTIEFTIGHLAAHSPRDFDVVDFLLLEILRINERALYEKLPSQKAELTGMHFFYPPEKRGEYLTSLLSSVPTARRDPAETIFRDLFPRFGTTGFRTAHTARVNPVSQYETFDRFFFSIPGTEYADEELSSLLRDRRDAEAFLRHLRNARASGRLSTVMRHLMEDDEPLTEEIAESLMLVLTEFAPELRPHDQSARAAILNEIQILAWRALSALSSERRDEIFVDLFKGPHPPVLGVLLSPTYTQQSEPIVSANAATLANAELETWLRGAAENDSLLTARSGEMLLWAWHRVAPQNVRDFLAKAIESPANAHGSATVRQ